MRAIKSVLVVADMRAIKSDVWESADMPAVKSVLVVACHQE